MSKTRTVARAAALAAVLATGGVHADAISIETVAGDPPGPPTEAAYQLECTSAGCDIHGITASEDPPTSVGTVNDATSTALFGTGDSSVATEASVLSTLLGVDSSLVTGTRDDTPNSTFSTDALWFAVKQSQWVAFFRNNSGGTITLDFERNQGSGFDAVNYSHVTEFSVVPIPAAAWLFGSALVGMAGVGYRRSRKQSA